MAPVFAKCGGNYAASLLGEYRGISEGCEQVCFVDAATKTYLEELGGMNMMVVYKDGHVETPSLTATSSLVSPSFDYPAA